MEAKSVARYVRIAPRKVRLVLDLIRGKRVGEAIAILQHTPRGASPIVEKVLKSALANAEHNYEMNVEELVVSQAMCNEGPTLKRFRPRAMGRASRINKRTSHVTLIVTEQELPVGQTAKPTVKESEPKEDNEPKQVEQTTQVEQVEEAKPVNEVEQTEEVKTVNEAEQAEQVEEAVQVEEVEQVEDADQSEQKDKNEKKEG